MKQLVDAREFYTRALMVKCADNDINMVCLNNRAQCNLELSKAVPPPFLSVF